jgi:hypothetical protein
LASSVSSIIDAAAGVDDQHARGEHAPLAEVVLHPLHPLLALALGHLGVAVAGQIDEAQLAPHAAVVGGDDAEEVEQPRPPRRGAHAHEAPPAEERAEQRRLADVGSAGERHLARALSGPRRRVGPRLLELGFDYAHCGEV